MREKCLQPGAEKVAGGMGLGFPDRSQTTSPRIQRSLLGLQEASPSKEAGRAECVGLHWGVLRLTAEILLEKRPWRREARLGPAVVLNHAGGRASSISFNPVSDPAAALLSSNLTL